MSDTPPIISCKKRYNVLHVKGSGCVKYGAIICTICNGSKYIMCNSTGLARMPYDTFCDGAGEFEFS